MERFDMKDALRFLWKYIRPYRKHFAAFYVGWLVDTLISVLNPILFGIMLDEIVYRKDTAGFFSVSLVVVIMSAYSCILYYWLYAQHHYLMIMYTFRIKMDIFEHFMKICPEELNKRSAGEIITLLQEYPEECMHFLIRGFIHQINRGIIVISVLFLSFRINTGVGFLMVILSLLCSAATLFLGRKGRHASMKQKNLYGRYMGWIYEVLERLTDIRFLSSQNKVRNKFKEFSRKLFHEQNKIRLFQAVSGQVLKGIFLLSQLTLFAIAAGLSAGGILTIGTFTVVMNYFNKLTDAVTVMNGGWNDAQTRAGYVHEIKKFLELETEDNGGHLSLQNRPGSVQLDHICFSYGEKAVYDDFSLHVNDGEHIAITGVSGSGKSTLAELIIGMQKPDRGSVCIDGVDISRYSKASLRRCVGIVLQESLLFEGTIRDNLLLGNRRASGEEIENALRFAELYEDICDLPDGIDTVIGPGQTELSGGQRQRMAIAQVYLRNPKIIIFDEPTSALDSETERKLLQKWRTFLTGHTVFIITHRKRPLEVCERMIEIRYEE